MKWLAPLAQHGGLDKAITDRPTSTSAPLPGSGLAAECLRKAGYVVATGIGKTGAIGLLRNGEVPTVMLRADMAPPVGETTDVAYASKVTVVGHAGKSVPVMQACRHDMHDTWGTAVGHGTGTRSNASDRWP